MCTFLSHCFETKNYHWSLFMLFKILQKTTLLKKFAITMFGHITWKQLNSLTSVDMFSLCGQKVMHQTAVQEVPGSIPVSGKD